MKSITRFLSVLVLPLVALLAACTTTQAPQPDTLVMVSAQATPAAAPTKPLPYYKTTDSFNFIASDVAVKSTFYTYYVYGAPVSADPASDRYRSGYFTVTSFSGTVFSGPFDILRKEGETPHRDQGTADCTVFGYDRASCVQKGTSTRLDTGYTAPLSTKPVIVYLVREAKTGHLLISGFDNGHFAEEKGVSATGTTY